MTDIQIIMFCTTVIAISACVIHNSTKKIAASLYRRMVTGEIEPLKPNHKSPYGISREKDTDGNWGYCITKNDKIVYSHNKKKAIVYSRIESAIKDMNIFEHLEGYEKTKLN